MYFRRNVLPIVHCGYSQARATATAAKIKPRSSLSEPHLDPPPPSQWTEPISGTTAGPSSDYTSKSTARTHPRPSAVNELEPNTNEWNSSTTPLASYTQVSPSATPSRSSLSKWAPHPEAQNSFTQRTSSNTSQHTCNVQNAVTLKPTLPSQSAPFTHIHVENGTVSQAPESMNPEIPQFPFPSSSTSSPRTPFSTRPPHLSQAHASSSDSNRAHTASSVQHPRGDPEQGTSQRRPPWQQTAPSRYTSQSSSRLERDIAPHQALQQGSRSSRYAFDRFPSQSGSPATSVLRHRQNVKDRAFGSPLPPIWRDHDRSSRSRVREDAQMTESPNMSSGKGEAIPSQVTADLEDRSHTRGAQRNRVAHKERGTLLSRKHEDLRIHSHSRSSPASQRLDPARLKKKRSLSEKHVSADVYIPSTVSVGTLARLLNVRLERLQRQMRLAGMKEEANYDYVLTSDYAVLLAEEFGRNPIVNDEAAFDLYPSPPHPNPITLPSRPPVVTIMGHVDHGKTTLLDTLRSSSVAKGEAGGITQHIGAFSVPVPPTDGNADGPRSITFLDTPGHAAFSAMRARGAGVTDIVVLVVAADDGVMPQTKEVIELIQKEQDKVGLVVAINKVDKPSANVDAVHHALMAEGIQLEVFGGDVPSVEVSGLTGHGLPQLVEVLSAMAELQDLRAERGGPVHGYVLESKVQKGLGPVATVLVLRGCLVPGSFVISGVSQAKVRVMSDSTGASVNAAYPGMAVTVSGWKTLPNAGDEVLQGSEGDIKKAVVNRLRKAENEASLVDVEAINASRRRERERREIEADLGVQAKTVETDSPEGPKELRLIVKGDVSGSVEAVVGALQGIGNGKAVTKIVSSGVGDISESDVMMARAVGGMVVAFSVSTPRAIETLAAQNNVPTCSSNIIYKLMDEIKARVIALLPVIIEKRVTGEATVLQLFDIQLKAKQTKTVAGCRVVNGIIEKARHARVVRDGITLHEGSLDTMRHLKKDVAEVRKGSECGLSLNGFGDLREGDMIQMYQIIEKPGVL